MPTYDYECIDEKCKNKFEVFLSMSELDSIVPKCPKCNSDSKRLISGGTGIIFKGSGFYVNDYPKPGSTCNKPNCNCLDKDNKKEEL